MLAAQYWRRAVDGAVRTLRLTNPETGTRLPDLVADLQRRWPSARELDIIMFSAFEKPGHLRAAVASGSAGNSAAQPAGMQRLRLDGSAHGHGPLPQLPGIESLRRLTNLEVSGPVGIASSSAQLASLTACTRLAHLSLRFNQTPPRYDLSEGVLRLVEHCPVVRLELEGCIRPSQGQEFDLSFAGSRLTALRMSSCDPGERSMCSTLAALSRLASLELCHCSLTVGAFLDFADLRPPLTCLELNLDDSMWCAWSLTALAALTGLQRLRPGSLGSAAGLLDALSGLQQLSHLDLGGAGITLGRDAFEQLAALGQMRRLSCRALVGLAAYALVPLAAMTGLEHLDLSENYELSFEPGQLAHLSALSRLTSLRLCHCALDSEEGLVAALRGMHRLRLLDLEDNPLPQRIVPHIAEAGCPLQEFCAGYGDDGSGFPTALTSLSALRILRLSWPWVSGMGDVVLATVAALPDLGHLELLRGWWVGSPHKGNEQTLREAWDRAPVPGVIFSC